MLQVIKRSGELVEFDLQKICNAVQKAFDATKTAYTEDMIELIAMRVTSDFQDKIADGRIDVESIQDSAEKVIAACGFEEVAKAYILYRQQRARLREMRQTVLDYRDVVNSYVYMDARELASPDDAAISIGGLILSNSAAVTERYWLSEIYDEEITYAHKNGDIHIHDLSMLTGGSAGWPLIRLIREGLGGVSGQNTSAPARHLPVLCGQLVSFATLAQNEWAGAQTFSSFDTYLAPYVKADHLSYDAVYRIIESFVFGINLPTGIGMQPPFVILALDGVIPGDLYHEPAYVGSEQMSFTYGDCQREASMIAGALLSVLLEGDANGARFAYPVLVYGVTDAFDKDENASLALSLAIKYGTIQFANYIGGDISPEDLRMFSSGEMPDTDRLAGKAVGSYGSGEQCGSIGTVSINLARIAYQSVNEQEFYHRIDHILAIAARALKTKRSVLTQLHGEGLFPYTARYFGDFTRAFSTIGVLGMNEAVLNASWIREDLTGGKAKRFAKEVLVHLRAKIRLYQEMYGDYHELQATTEEAVRLRLAKSDRMEFPKILLANHPGEAPVYTAGSELADDCEGEPAKLSEAQDLLQIQYNGGTIFRIPVDDGPDQVRRKTGLLQFLCENCRMPFLSFSPVYSICPEHGYFKGEVFECPHCKRRTQVFGRTGSSFSAGDLRNRIKSTFDERSRMRTAPVGKAVVMLPEEAELPQEAEPVILPEEELSHPEEPVRQEELKANPEQEEEHVNPEQEEQETFLDEDLPEEEAFLPAEGSDLPDGLYLFVVPADPNSMQAKQYLKGTQYTLVNAMEHLELALSLSIIQAPVLVCVAGGIPAKYTGLARIRKYVQNND